MRLTLAAAVVVFGLIALRIVAVGQYPKVHPNEGYWSSGPRNWALYDDALMDGRLHSFLSPAHFALLAACFRVVPPDLVSARLVSVAIGLCTCGLIYLLARHCASRRPWLWVVLFGFSGLTILIQRSALLESHQMFWLVLAALFWLRRPQGNALAAAAAFGIALLVKMNSIYLLPAFLLALPGSGGASGEPISRRAIGRCAAVFLFVCALVAGGGYLALWLYSPGRFADAFHFELEGNHFVDGGVLFHVGRFGLHPYRTGMILKNVLMTDPILPPLAIIGLAMLLLRPRAMTRADWFFGAWFVFGFVFTFGQIFVPHRYVTTMMPAVAYLAARTLDRLMSWAALKPTRHCLLIAVSVLLLVFCGVNAAKTAAGVWRRPNDVYWQAVDWIAANRSDRDVALAAPAIGLSLPMRSLDYFRLIFHYDGTQERLGTVVKDRGITILVADFEWREHQNADMAEFVQKECTLQQSFGKDADRIDIYRVN